MSASPPPSTTSGSSPPPAVADAPPSSHNRGRGSQRFGMQDFWWGRTLGEGSYARVLHARLKSNEKDYAIKVMEKRHIRKENKVKQVLTEKTVLSRIGHACVVKLWFTFQDVENLYLVLDLLPGGELLQVIRARKAAAAAAGKTHVACDEGLARFYVGEVLLALEYLHAEGVVHRDVKPENVLLGADGHIKLTDFGSALLLQPGEQEGGRNGNGRVAAADKVGEEGNQENDDDEEDNGHRHSFVGTAEYVSPEMLANEPATPAVDLWAVGCLLFQLLTGDPPFRGNSDYLIFQDIMGHCNGSQPLLYPSSMGESARALIESLLLRVPGARLGAGPVGSEHDFGALKRHAFFADAGFAWDGVVVMSAPFVPEVAVEVTEGMRDGKMEREDWGLALEEGEEALPVTLEDLDKEEEEEEGFASLCVNGNEEEEEENEEEEERRLRQWDACLDAGEHCLFTNLVVKRTGLVSKRRQLVLTDARRLVYFEPKTLERKGEVERVERVEVKGEHAFDVVTPQRPHHFVDAELGAAVWATRIRESLGLVVSSSPAVSPSRQGLSFLGLGGGGGRKEEDGGGGKK